MRKSELFRAIKDEFGDYANIIIKDSSLGAIGSYTVEQALKLGISENDIWKAICLEYDVPVYKVHGRGLLEPKK